MNKRTLLLCHCALFCALLILSALLFRFTIPGTDVMVTMQTLFVLLCGQLLPPRYCVYTTGAYLMAGLLGLPVFSAVNGPAVVSTPSFGYLIAFPAASFTCSLICKRMATKKGGRYIASLCGTMVLYLLAVLYIILLSHLFLYEALSLKTILPSYVLIFMPVDIVKAVFAAWLGQRMHKRTLQFR